MIAYVSFASRLLAQPSLDRGLPSPHRASPPSRRRPDAHMPADRPVSQRNHPAPRGACCSAPSRAARSLKAPAPAAPCRAVPCRVASCRVVSCRVVVVLVRLHRVLRCTALLHSSDRFSADNLYSRARTACCRYLISTPMHSFTLTFLASGQASGWQAVVTSVRYRRGAVR